MYVLCSPHPLLQPYIESYWCLRVTLEQPFSQRIPVDGQADLMFNFGSEYQREHTHTTPVELSQASSHFDAQREYPIQILQNGAIYLISVRFQVGGVAAFIDPPLSLFENQTVDILDVFGKDILELEACLFEMVHQQHNWVNLLDKFFLKHLKQTTKFITVQNIMQFIQRTHGQIRIQHLAKEIGYSIRTLDRLFGQVLGLSPKFYRRIIRHQHALQLMQTTTKSLAEIAFLSHYHDQAHFHKDFSAFMGQTPELYRLEHVQFLQEKI
jgi:AraC-like DNA-binding protein